ncbi:phenylacetate-CoA oxygenase/reductase subunit PaaK [Pseudomonas putida]|uniref:Phenylacetate-CoA oxygenase/reductase subunit PaaK n=1 Tax=Pseudomonas hunanensis TaxID=1247546 RepID=A0ABD6NDZ8_9PSED|nr:MULTISPECIES: 1,2-phenylacetyl-CoA epoxidase subunit PaaE [Pseudomonas]MDD2140764.1 phenylacetate-CoA oxygenase/reductase subunit PaaK [Pseudomonas putida]NWL46650.1 phenylacetate-CoA oxygenase/reductase subunit PaaK [Pseudomonas hunanensis]HDS1724110.1 phenylacetate-CoA oxygenase/reductase subunit PaaK [Pseudomonas putida]
MSQFHSLTIKQVRNETRDAVSIAFDVPEHLQDQFRFTQGQYLVMRTQLDNEEVRRSYSICSAVQDGELRVAVKRVPGGRFSAFANEVLKEGQQLEVMPPSGSFFVPLDPARQGNYLGVAAGSGITPILSIIATTLASEPHSRFTLLYGNRSSSGALFRDKLEDLKNRYLDRLNLIFVFSREQQDVDLYNGRIDADKCGQLFSRWLDVAGLDAAFICGPQAMTETVRDSLQANGMAKERIHFELFAAAGSEARREAREAARQVDSALSHITVISDGRALSFDLPRNTQNVLDAGNAIGAELPYSCKAGVCSTCKCRVIEGEVEMDSNHALEDYEVAAGYVLSCQTYPVSDRVVLDFDQL